MSEALTSPKVRYLLVDIASTAEFILGLQQEDGEIPWSVGGKTDPWDMVESAMGLTVAGYWKAAARAYDWLIRNQLKDGSFYSATRQGVTVDATRETHMAAYLAVGAYHYYLITGDRGFLEHLWPAVRSALHYALHLQTPSGEIYWARNPKGQVDPMALLTGCCSIYLSLKCGLRIASLLGKTRPEWKTALHRLGEAIRHRPDCFNMIKSRYSMDWYYPVLCGAVTGNEAQKRIERSWEKFTVPGWGVRCVSDRPWVTMAETSELVLTLAAVGDYDRAEEVFGWLRDKKYDDGSYWMGVTFPDQIIWPEEKTSWTAAAVLLAYDALNELTPGSRLFRHDFWEDKEGEGPSAQETGPLKIP